MIFAAFPFVTIFAFAYVFVESILTNTTVETGLRGAFINVGLAPRTIESTGTLAFVASHHINAVTAILTRIARALVNVDLAVSSRVARMTTTLIVVDAIHTFSIDARVIDAIVFVDLTMFAASAGKTLTSVAA